MRLSRRRFLALTAASPVALALNACLGSDDPEVVVLADGQPVTASTATPVPTATSTPAPLPFTPRATNSDLDPEDLQGFTMPVADACLPSSERLMPNAPRTYRNGVHEGVDFYFGDSCVVIDRGTPVLSMYEGVVIRADHDYEELTPGLLAELEVRTAERGYSDEETLDVYRGRQVWVDHGNEVITRYCHLESIAPGVSVGLEVRAGDHLGGIGESGTPESVTDPGTEIHLHAEVRVGDSFLGEDLPAEEVRRLYTRLFEADDGSAES